MNKAINEDTTALLSEWRSIKDSIQPQLDRLKHLETRIKSHCLETRGLPWLPNVAKTSFRKGYIRSSWNNKGLRGYAVVNPEILIFLKETSVKEIAIITALKSPSQ